jgi:hypothetical protein
MSAITLNTDTEYFAYDAINASRLKKWIISPAHYFNDVQKPQTDAMREGSAFHAVALDQPVKVFGEKLDGRSKAGKEQRAAIDEFIKSNPDTVLMFQDEYEKYKAMQAAIMAHPGAAALLSAPNQIKETGIVWQHESGAMCKIKPDTFWPSKKSGRNVLVDLKTCRDASPRGFEKMCRDYDYAVSDALYRKGVTALTGKECGAMHFILVEKEPPYYVGVYKIEEYQHDIVSRWIDETLATIQAYHFTNQSPWINSDHKQGFFTAELPAWYMEKF